MSARPGPIYDAALEKFTNLEIEIQEEIENIKANGSPELLKVEPIALAPRKADITIEQVVLAWTRGRRLRGSAGSGVLAVEERQRRAALMSDHARRFHGKCDN